MTEITEIDVSSLLAPIRGETTAIAEAPQTDNPDASSTDTFLSILNILAMRSVEPKRTENTRKMESISPQRNAPSASWEP